MTKDETLKLALEHIEGNYTVSAEDAITAIKEALAQPAQEPDQKKPQHCGTGYCSCIECVMKPSPRAWVIEFENGDEELHFDEQSVGEIHVPLYTTPPQRTWVGLTDEEITELHYEIKVRLMGAYKTEDIYRAIEAKLKEKNNG